jgi:hypothetical protein
MELVMVMRAIVVLAGLGLCGCSGGGGADNRAPGSTVPPSGAPFGCAPIGGGAATTSAGCVNCPSNAIAGRAASVDADFGSAATMTLYNPGDSASLQGQMSLRGIAQSGIVFPEGGRAGLVVRLPDASSIAYTATVTTYLGGTVQEARAVETEPSSSGELAYFGFDAATPTTQQFDAIELAIVESAPSLEEHVFQVLEFCSDGG